jgi:hypothetical protein
MSSVKTSSLSVVVVVLSHVLQYSTVCTVATVQTMSDLPRKNRNKTLYLVQSRLHV